MQDDFLEVDSVAQLKAVMEAKRETDQQLDHERMGNRLQRRNFKLLWRASQEKQHSIRHYTKHVATRAEIKKRRK